MCLQASITSPEYLSIWNSLPVDFERVIGLEATYKRKTNTSWDSKINKR